MLLILTTLPFLNSAIKYEETEKEEKEYLEAFFPLAIPIF